MYELAFSNPEHTLHLAGNGLEALRLIEELERCDVILLDPMHGLEFIREVRWNPRLRSVPIIAVTSESEQSEMVSTARVLNVAAVAHKPWEPQKLRALVAKVVGEKTEGRG